MNFLLKVSKWMKKNFSFDVDFFITGGRGESNFEIFTPV